MSRLLFAISLLSVYRAEFAVSLSGSDFLEFTGSALELGIQLAISSASEKVVLRGEVSVGELFLSEPPSFQVAHFASDPCDGPTISDQPGLSGLLRNVTGVRGFSVAVEAAKAQTFLGLLRYRGQMIGKYVDNLVISVHKTNRPCADILGFWHTEISSLWAPVPRKPELTTVWELRGFRMIGNINLEWPARHCLAMRGFGAERLQVGGSEISAPADSAMFVTDNVPSVRVMTGSGGDRKFEVEISDLQASAVGPSLPLKSTFFKYSS